MKDNVTRPSTEQDQIIVIDRLWCNFKSFVFSRTNWKKIVVDFNKTTMIHKTEQHFSC